MLIVLFIIFAFFAAIYLAPGPLVGWLGRFLVVDETPAGSDVIVVLIGGPGPERILKAQELYSRGLAKQIVFGTGYLPQEVRNKAGLVWLSEGERNKRALVSLGVAEAAITVIDTRDAHDTSSELKRIAEALNKQRVASSILVTSASHSQRAALIWRRSAPEIYTFVVSAGTDSFATWWTSSYLRVRVAYEYFALIKELPKQLWFEVNRAINFISALREEPSVERG